MTTLVTGAAGFVGSSLLKRLTSNVVTESVFATDLSFPMESRLDGVNYLCGAIDDDEHLKLLTERTLKHVFHLATVAGVQSANLQIGKRVNLTATLALLDHLSEQRPPTRLVYSSSVGVFGKPMPKIVDDETLPNPQWSYGAHKLACEILITDYARLGLVDGIVLRFPGIVARPEGSTTMLSAFINNVFYAAHSGRPFKLPLAPEDGTWLMSLRRCLDNVLHAAALPGNQLSTHRVFTLPALFVTMTELVDALAEVYGASLRKIITYEPTDAARQLFAMVPLRANRALAAGFKGDESPRDLVQNVILENQALTPAS